MLINFQYISVLQFHSSFFLICFECWTLPNNLQDILFSLHGLMLRREARGVCVILVCLCEYFHCWLVLCYSCQFEWEEGRGEWRHWPLVDTNKLVWPKLNGTLVGVAGTARPHCHSQTFYRARGTPPPLLSYIHPIYHLITYHTLYIHNSWY